ncbi:prepilin peptidase [Nocardia thraciensis]
MTPVAFGLLTVWCAVLSAVDLRERRLPNPLTGAGALAVFGYALTDGRLVAAVTGALLLSVPYLVVHLASPAAFGAGDVKLSVGLGAAAACGGGPAWAWAAIAAPLLTAAAGLIALALPPARAGPGSRTVPHGPSMCVSTLLALLLAG